MISNIFYTFLLFLLNNPSAEEILPEGGFFDSMGGPIMTILLSGILSLITIIIKGREDRKKIKLELDAERVKMELEFSKNDKKISERERLNQQQLVGFENKLVSLSMDVLDIQNNSKFKRELMNSLREIATNIIDYNMNLPPRFKDILMIMAREIEDFALRFYYSDKRGTEHEILPYLKIDMESRIFKLKLYLDFLKIESKIIHEPQGRRKVTFLEFMKDTNIRQIMSDAISELAKDGLKEKETIELFQKFLEDFFKEFIIAINSWAEVERKSLKDNILKKTSSEIEKIREDLKFTD